MSIYTCGAAAASPVSDKTEAAAKEKGWKLTIATTRKGRVMRSFGRLACRACNHIPEAADYVELIDNGSLICDGCGADLALLRSE
jgi:hypothetical protein